MKQALYQAMRQLYWRLPITDDAKEVLVARARRLKRWYLTAFGGVSHRDQDATNQDYIDHIVSIPEARAAEFVGLNDVSFSRADEDPKIIAYYLAQFHPTPYNDEWWGKGVTEWNNVARAVPQYSGHYQPRLPGELGYYDLRLVENLRRQVELAKLYGVYGFSFYYYWFDGRRLLDGPLDLFVRDMRIDFPFSLCWANESWTRRFDGTCGETLVEQNASKESYRAFIGSVIAYMRDENYIRINDRPVLTIYRPSFIPDISETLEYWRTYCLGKGVGDPYLIGVKEHTWDRDLVELGFDAQSEFHPGTLFKHTSDITSRFRFVRDDFGGMVLDYRDIVENKRYFQYSYKKLYRAVMPMWDNTARRNQYGMIFHGSEPSLYRRWLKDVIEKTKTNQALDDSLIFINAWNEWGEGAYLEPDRYYGYAYLQATRDAIESSRNRA